MIKYDAAGVLGCVAKTSEKKKPKHIEIKPTENVCVTLTRKMKHEMY